MFNYAHKSPFPCRVQRRKSRPFMAFVSELLSHSKCRSDMNNNLRKEAMWVQASWENGDVHIGPHALELQILGDVVSSSHEGEWEIQVKPSQVKSTYLEPLQWADTMYPLFQDGIKYKSSVLCESSLSEGSHSFPRRHRNAAVEMPWHLVPDTSGT